MILPLNILEPLETFIDELYTNSTEIKDYEFTRTPDYIKVTLIAKHNTPFTVTLDVMTVLRLHDVEQPADETYLEDAVRNLSELKIEDKLINHIKKGDPQFEDYVTFNHLRIVFRDILREKFDTITL